MDSCRHDRVVRLQVPDRGDYWICTVCNARFIEKSVVDYKICHLTTELAKRLVDEQAAGVWGEESISI